MATMIEVYRTRNLEHISQSTRNKFANWVLGYRRQTAPWSLGLAEPSREIQARAQDAPHLAGHPWAGHKARTCFRHLRPAAVALFSNPQMSLKVVGRGDSGKERL